MHIYIYGVNGTDCYVQVVVIYMFEVHSPMQATHLLVVT